MYKVQFRAHKNKETDWQSDDHKRCTWLLVHSLVWFVLSWIGDQPRHVIPCSFNNIVSRVENKHLIQAFTDSAKLRLARRSLMLLVLRSGGQVPLKRMGFLSTLILLHSVTGSNIFMSLDILEGWPRDFKFWRFADRASQYIYLWLTWRTKVLFYNKFISCLYMFRAYVLIIRRSKLHYTASGIIAPIGGRLVHRLREDCARDGHL